MTNQNNAAQAADKEIREAFELIYASDAADPACAADLFHFTNGWRALLSKLRAPVADERAAFEAWEKTASVLSPFAAWKARAALANAPVAGEAQGWRGWACQYPSKLPRLYGAKEIAELNCDPANGDRMLFLSEDAAPQASAEPVRILFPAHLRKMWSGGEVQAWLDQQQGVTPPKAGARGSLERYRKWQAEQAEARNAGIEVAAAWIDKRRQDFDHEHGYMEAGTGAWSFGTGAHAEAKAEYSAELDEIAEGIRALKQPQADKEQQ